MQFAIIIYTSFPDYHNSKNVLVTLRSWWDSDRIEMIVDPMQHSSIALSVSLEVSSQYLIIILYGLPCVFTQWNLFAVTKNAKILKLLHLWFLPIFSSVKRTTLNEINVWLIFQNIFHYHNIIYDVRWKRALNVVEQL